MYYFAYGTDLSKKVMRERCPGCKPLFTATLPHHKLIFVGWSRVLRGGVPTVRPFRGERVRGGVYEVTEADLRRLDRIEGYPQTSTRLNVTVFDEEGNAFKAVTYSRVGEAQEAPPAREHLAAIQQGYQDWGIV